MPRPRAPAQRPRLRRPRRKQRRPIWCVFRPRARAASAATPPPRPRPRPCPAGRRMRPPPQPAAACEASRPAVAAATSTARHRGRQRPTPSPADCCLRRSKPHASGARPPARRKRRCARQVADPLDMASPAVPDAADLAGLEAAVYAVGSPRAVDVSDYLAGNPTSQPYFARPGSEVLGLVTMGAGTRKTPRAAARTRLRRRWRSQIVKLATPPRGFGARIPGYARARLGLRLDAVGSQAKRRHGRQPDVQLRRCGQRVLGRQRPQSRRPHRQRYARHGFLLVVDERRRGRWIFVRPAVRQYDAREFDADFDDDGNVDGSDFLTWQRGLGIGAFNYQGDADGDQDVDGVDLAGWRSEFGAPQSSVAAAGAVPEPEDLALAMLAVGPRRARTLTPASPTPDRSQRFQVFDQGLAFLGVSPSFSTAL